MRVITHKLDRLIPTISLRALDARARSWNVVGEPEDCSLFLARGDGLFELGVGLSGAVRTRTGITRLLLPSLGERGDGG